MGSIIRRAAVVGVGAAALALGLGATPALAASSAAPASSGAAVAQSSGHWQLVATVSSARSCLNIQNYYLMLGFDAHCDFGELKVYIWVAD
jgi:hypothetical protein